jgi:hypothetical protein
MLNQKFRAWVGVEFTVKTVNGSVSARVGVENTVNGCGLCCIYCIFGGDPRTKPVLYLL